MATNIFNFSDLVDKTAPTGGILTINSSSTFGSLITSLIPVIFTLSGIALLVYLIIGGIGFMTAGSDPKKMESAKGSITAALIGFVIIFVAYWLVQIIGLVFNIEAIKSIFGR